jgi:class 3 adenylate cyclase
MPTQRQYLNDGDVFDDDEMVDMSFRSCVDIDPSPAQQMQASTTSWRDSTTIHTGGDAAADADYARHPILLWFRDAAVEQRFCDFIYIESGFIGGKLYAGVALAVMVISYFLFPKGGPNVGVLSDPWWVPTHVNFVVSGALLGCMFIQRLHKYRETVFLVILGTHWPAFATMIMFGKEPHSHSYAYITCCYFYCCFVVQCRFARVAPFLCFSPIATLLLTTFALSDYYDTHSHFEIMWWILVVFPIGLLMTFERKSRQAFVDMEVAHAAADASERKTMVTRNLIVNFFSATATRDLLLKHGPRSKFYPKTVLVKSDIVMFAEYLDRTEPAEVIAMLTDFFLAIENIARDHDVERIATVGDGYFGAIFAADEEPGLVRSISLAERDRVDDDDGVPMPSFITRCSNGVIFACSILRFARGLQVRSGVHVGDVTGGFVGCKPPKFDLFGTAVEHVNMMETTSRSGAAHVSHDIVHSCKALAGPLGVHATSEHGIQCHAWNHQNPADATVTDQLLDLHHDAPPASTHIVAVLCEIGEDDEFTARAHESGDVDPRTGQVTPQHDSTTEEESSRLMNDNVTADLQFHPLLLSFNRPSVEARFCRSVRRSDINSVACKFWIVMELTLILAHANMGCFQSRDDRKALSAIVGIVALLVAYLGWIGTAHRFNTPLISVGFFSIFVVAVLSIRSDCTDGLPRQEFYTANVFMLYWMIAACVPQFCLDVRLALRLLILVACAASGAALLVVRRELMHPTTAAWDTGTIPMITLGFAAMSYFADFSLRRAFVAVLRLKRLQVIASGRHTAMSSKAMGIMLPQFVIDRIVRATTVVSDEGMSEYRSSGESSRQRHLTSATGSSRVSIDFTNAHPVWDFASVGVLMINFTVAHSLADSFTTIRRVINHVEAVIANHGVFKLKTVGTTIMCLLGIDDSLTPETCALTLVVAARAVRAQVLTPLTDSLHENASFRISIHAGPCFGAVIGAESVIFDVFGETINIAVALLPHAPERRIQITDALEALLLPESVQHHRFTVTPAGAIKLPKRPAHFCVSLIGDAPTAFAGNHT